MDINALANQAIDRSNARYNQRLLTNEKPPESGFIISLDKRLAEIQTTQGVFYAKSSSSGGGQIGDKVSLYITTQGTNFFNVIPR